MATGTEFFLRGKACRKVAVLPGQRVTALTLNPVSDQPNSGVKFATDTVSPVAFAKRDTYTQRMSGMATEARNLYLA